MNLISHLQQRIAPYLSDTTSVVVAVSAGLDSMVLAACLDKLDVNFVIAHMKHGLRDDAYLDEQLIFDVFGTKRQIYTSSIDLRQFAKDNRLSLEEAGRIKRYAFLEDIRQQTGAEFIVTGHHHDDMLESLFLHLFRGSGIRGMCPMEEYDQSRYLLRPMLQITKEDLYTFAKNEDIRWREDTTNTDVSLDRNAIRQKVIPEVKKYFPAVEKSMLSHAMHMRDAEEFIVQELQQRNADPFQNAWSKDICSLPDFLGRYWFLLLHHRLFAAYSAHKIEENWQTLQEMRSGGKIYIRAGIYITRYRNTITLIDEGKREVSAENHWNVQGSRLYWNDLPVHGLEQISLREIQSSDTLVFVDQGKRRHKKIKNVWAEHNILQNERANFRIVCNSLGEGLALVGRECISYIGIFDSTIVTFQFFHEDHCN